jgi:hypothetical protein
MMRAEAAPPVFSASMGMSYSATDQDSDSRKPEGQISLRISGVVPVRFSPCSVENRPERGNWNCQHRGDNIISESS